MHAVAVEDSNYSFGAYTIGLCDAAVANLSEHLGERRFTFERVPWLALSFANALWIPYALWP